MNEILNSTNVEDNITLFNQWVMLIAFLTFILLIFKEALTPLIKFDRKTTRDSIVTNSAAFIFNNIILSLLKVSSLFYIAQEFSYLGFLSEMENGLEKWIIAFLCYDLAIYAWHRYSHFNETLWRLHKIHHSDRSFNVTTGFRFHMFDIFLETLYKCFLIMILGADVILILSIELIHQVFIFFHHSNLKFNFEQKASKLIITPDLHRAHHSTKRDEHDSNYGIVLSIWDYIFKTRNVCVPKKIGLDLIEAENFYQLFFLAFISENKMRKLRQIFPKGKRN